MKKPSLKEEKARRTTQSLDEDDFIIQKPRKLPREFLRGFRVLREYLRATYAFRDISNCVTFFGSARQDESHEYYQQARKLGGLLAQAGYTVMTGGGPGIMEAVNRGAQEAHGFSVGCNILLPEEQRPNLYLDRWITLRYFFVRKMMLTKYSVAFIAMPGGFGTLDELFEMATLIQTGKIKNFPLVLMGCDFWKPLLDYLKDTLLKNHTISQNDLEKIFITDSPEEALNYIKTHNGILRNED